MASNPMDAPASAIYMGAQSWENGATKTVTLNNGLYLFNFMFENLGAYGINYLWVSDDGAQESDSKRFKYFSNANKNVDGFRGSALIQITSGSAKVSISSNGFTLANDDKQNISFTRIA